MPVTTVSADQISWINGRPTVASRSYTNNKADYKSPQRGKRYKCRAEQLTPLLDLVTPGSPVAVDCEGVQLVQEVGSRRRGVGRISIVNTKGQVIYDTFVYYPADVEHRPSPQRLNLGVKYKDIRPENGAQPHAEVLAAAKAVFDKSGIIVAHAASNDMQMLRGIDFSTYVVRDTQQLSGFPSFSGRRGLPALSDLAADVLDRSIQIEEHSSVEDARATMDLFLWHHDKYGSGLDYTGKALAVEISASDSDRSSPSTALDSDSPTSSSALTRQTSSSSSGSSLAPGHLVALPDIKALAQGRVFDRKTSTYS